MHGKSNAILSMLLFGCRCHSCCCHCRCCYLCVERQLFGQAQNRFRNLSTAKRSTAKYMYELFMMLMTMGIEWSLLSLARLDPTLYGYFSFRCWGDRGWPYERGHRSPSKGVSNEPRKKRLNWRLQG